MIDEVAAESGRTERGVTVCGFLFGVRANPQ
jgi:hypothetical protein